LNETVAFSLALLSLALLWPALDAAGRLLRLSAFQGPGPLTGRSPERVLAIVPARAEGSVVLGIATDLAREARSGAPTALEAVIVLDGDDPAAVERLRGSGVEVLVKSPAGPDKGAVLSFASGRLSERIAAVSYVMVFDADTRLPDGWLAALRVPDEADAFQLPGRPAGVPRGGAPRVEALSLAVATRLEDLARDAAGLPVRLRGRAMGFSPAAWRIGPLASSRTTTEDSEATVRLLDAGIRVRALPGPLAFDEPARVGAMAGPRARWLAGHLKLAVVQAPALARLTATRPRAAFVLFSDLFLRPRTLVLAGLLAVALAGLGAIAVRPSLASAVAAPVFVATGTLLLELAYYRRGRALLGYPEELPPVSVSDLGAALSVWLRALGAAIAAPGRWHRARPEAR